MKNNDTTTDAMVNAWLAALTTAGKLYFVMLGLNEASVDVTDEWADLSSSQVGTQVLNRTSLTCVDRDVDCGAALVFDAVAAGVVYSVAVLTKTTASSPLVLCVQDINSGNAYDMDTLGALAIDAFVIRFRFQGET